VGLQNIELIQKDLAFFPLIIPQKGRPKSQTVLTALEGDLLQDGTGPKIIFNFCADGDYCQNKLIHLWKFIPRTHVHPCNGGAIVLHPGTPCRDAGLQKSYYDIYGFGTLYQMQMSMNLNKGQKIIIMAHSNCGVAGAFNLPARTVLLESIKSARHIAAYLGIFESRIVVMYTIDFTPFEEDVAKKVVRTYHCTKNSEALLLAMAA
jgi:hypothetical protein